MQALRLKPGSGSLPGAAAGRRPGGRRRGIAALCLTALGLLGASCSLGGGEPKNLPVACETADCDCAKDDGYVAKPPAVQWKTDGTASCPEGYHLHMAPPPSQRLTI